MIIICLKHELHLKNGTNFVSSKLLMNRIHNIKCWKFQKNIILTHFTQQISIHYLQYVLYCLYTYVKCRLWLSQTWKMKICSWITIQISNEPVRTQRMMNEDEKKSEKIENTNKSIGLKMKSSFPYAFIWNGWWFTYINVRTHVLHIKWIMIFKY